MAQTQNTISGVYGLLLDNTTGLISPQDVRDSFETWRMRHGQLYVTGAAGVGTTGGGYVVGTYVEATAPTWALSSGTQYEFDESGGNGRLTYTGTQDVMAHIACTVTLSVGVVNQTANLRLGINTGGGTTTDVASSASLFLRNNGDAYSTALHLIANFSTNDYVSLWVANATAANDITVSLSNLQVVTMPM